VGQTQKQAARVFYFGSAIAAFASIAHANLGSFAPADGYSLSVYSGGYNWCDVAYYNAGSYGPNSGGGPGPTLQAPNFGNWKVDNTSAGGFFGSAATRNSVVGTAPPYPTTNPLGLPAYIVGDHGPGRTDNSSLAVRNDNALGTVGPIKYTYDFDTYDTGGPLATSVTTGPVSFNIFMAATPGGPNNTGAFAGEKFTQSFMDSTGSIGAQWGYARDNEIIWRAGGAGPWNPTGLYTNGAWDGIDTTINLTSQTFELRFFDVVNNLWTTLAPAGTPLGNSMVDFSKLGWQMEDGVHGGLGGKNFFDDAKLTIPAPGAVALLGLGALATTRRRRS
jgi:hypothetical protein